MKRLLTIIAIGLAVCVLLASFVIAGTRFFSSTPHATVNTTIPGFPTPGPVEFPTPTSGTTTYTNSTFQYRLTYPADWFLNESNDSIRVTINITNDVGVPDPLVLEITVFNNPQHLSPVEWWNSTKTNETPVGLITLGSGVQAYLSFGLGQRYYRNYIVTHDSIAVDMISTLADQGNDSFVQAIVHSFTWIVS